MKQLVWLGAVILLAASCTERLVTPGGCPELCPGGDAVVVDTVLSPIFGGDSSFSGFFSLTDGVAMPVGNGGTLGHSRGVVKFIKRGDSVFAADTLRPFTIDSVSLSFVLQRRDSTIGGLSLEFYRLPSSFDSTSTFQEIDAAMTPDALLRTIPLPDDLRSARLPFILKGEQLDALEYAPEDSTTLVVGIKLDGPEGAGAYIGTSSAGDATPLYITYTDVGGADTTIQKQLLQRGVDQNLSVFEEGTMAGPDLLPVGGFPASRSLLRFELPAYLRDSATIIRATLELTPDSPIFGIAGDSVQIMAQSLLADLGAKSPVIPDTSAMTWVKTGTGIVSIELGNIASRWQGEDPLDAAFRVQMRREHSSFMLPIFRSSRSGSGQPKLRITYRPPLAQEGL